MTDITLLDGGMGQELVHRSGDKPTPLWSTQIMLDHPGLVADVHRSFTEAGATIATTNTYAIHRDRLTGTGLEDRFEELFLNALTEVKSGTQGARIAGSIGPLVASYRPDLHPDHDTALAQDTEVARLLAPVCDLLICETVVSLQHARAVLAGAQTTGLPIWIALSVDDRDGTKLRSGEALNNVLPIIGTGADAVLINCSAPEAIPASLEILSGSGLPYGAYANAFTQITSDFLKAKPTVDALSARRDLSPDIYAAHALAWVDRGATIIGGCCEVGPAHISEIAVRLRAAGHSIV